MLRETMAIRNVLFLLLFFKVAVVIGLPAGGAPERHADFSLAASSGSQSVKSEPGGTSHTQLLPLPQQLPRALQSPPSALQHPLREFSSNEGQSFSHWPIAGARTAAQDASWIESGLLQDRRPLQFTPEAQPFAESLLNDPRAYSQAQDPLAAVRDGTLLNYVTRHHDTHTFDNVVGSSGGYGPSHRLLSTAEPETPYTRPTSMLSDTLAHLNVEHMASTSTESRTPEEQDLHESSIYDSIFNVPQVLREFKFSEPPFKRHRGERLRYVDSEESVRKLINEELFNGKLKWVDLGLFPPSSNSNQRRMLFRSSRVLPLEIPDPIGYGRRRKIRMVVHGGALAGAGVSNQVGHPLHQRTYYVFWSVPEEPVPVWKTPTIQRHGAGFLEDEDHDEVNRFLDGKLAALRQVHEVPR